VNEMGVYIYLLAGISAPGSGQLAKQVSPSTPRKCRRLAEASAVEPIIHCSTDDMNGMFKRAQLDLLD